MNQLTNFFILILLFSCNISFSEDSIKLDTIRWSKNELVIELPKHNIAQIDNYEEGFFKTYTCFLDSTIITIHIGSMVKLPLIDLKKYSLSSEFKLGKDVYVLRGFYNYEFEGSLKKKYFREENYSKYGLTILYENVDESRLKFYEHILNNIKIAITN
jgi:hypothetical protein